MSQPTTAVNCLYLWEAANVEYPKIIDIYDQIASAFGGIPSDNDEYRFNRKSVDVADPGEVCDPNTTLDGINYGGSTTLIDGGSGPVLPKYIQLRDEIKSMLSNTCKNLDDTAAALNAASWEYAATDGLNSDDLKSHIDSNHPDSPYNQVK